MSLFKSLYEGFYDEEICAGLPADKYSYEHEKNITLGAVRYSRYIRNYENDSF